MLYSLVVQARLASFGFALLTAAGNGKDVAVLEHASLNVIYLAADLCAWIKPVWTVSVIAVLSAHAAVNRCLSWLTG